MRLNHNHTLIACCTGYVTQAIVNNFLPLLFVVLNMGYGVSLDKIGLLATVNFAIQMCVDFVMAKLAGRYKYRTVIVFAHIMAVAGMVLLGLSPLVASANIYPLIIASVFLYAVGGGLLEVLVSPMAEAMPFENKAGIMSFLHSFYCWGQLAVVLLSTGFFFVFGIDKWYIMSFLWAVIPLANGILFATVPIYQLDDSHNLEKGMSKMFKSGVFWLLLTLMVCSGASELAMAQWASYFAEMGLGVSKTVGDLLGPCMFALLMGISRIVNGRLRSEKQLKKSILKNAVLCLVCYFVATLSPHPLISIVGCGVCGYSVGIMWPGVYSLAAKVYPKGGTAMFAFLALAGDVGCSTGPTIVGFVSNALGSTNNAVKMGLLVVAVFPAVMILGMMLLKRIKRED